jgi:hypothetical protein
VSKRGHHYTGNALFFLRIGDALTKTMLELMKEQSTYR